jgi:hypothetical protein
MGLLPTIAVGYNLTEATVDHLRDTVIPFSVKGASGLVVMYHSKGLVVLTYVVSATIATRL